MYRSSTLLGSIILTIIFTTSCVESPRRPEHNFKIKKIEGITVARTTGGPAFSEPPLAFQLLYEPFQNSEIPWSQVGFAEDVSIDELGNLYVYDLPQFGILVYDRTGSFLRKIGRSGAEPGEFARCTIQSTANGLIRAWDRTQYRLSVFSIEGELIETHYFNRFRSTKYANNASADCIYADYNSAGLLVAYFRVKVPRTSEYKYIQGHLLFISTGGDTLAEYFTPPIRTSYRWVTPISDWASLPYSGAPVFAPTHDGHYLMGTGDVPVLIKYDEHGNEVGRIEIDLNPEPVSDEERDAIYDEYEPPIAAKESLRIPNTKAYWKAIYVDDRGFIWLRIPESMRRQNDEPGCICRLLSPDGEYLGDVKIPAEVFKVWNGRLAASSYYFTDKMPYLAVYSLVETDSGMKYR